MEWSTESIEKVICFIQERPFLFDLSSAELAWTCTKLWCKKLAQETCASFLCKFPDCLSPPLHWGFSAFFLVLDVRARTDSSQTDGRTDRRARLVMRPVWNRLTDIRVHCAMTDAGGCNVTVRGLQRRLVISGRTQSVHIIIHFNAVIIIIIIIVVMATLSSFSCTPCGVPPRLVLTRGAFILSFIHLLLRQP